MRQYNKLALGILITLAAIMINSCRSVANYQNSIFHDDSKIVKQSDSYTYQTQIGMREGNGINMEFTSFSGMETVYKIKSDGENNVVFAFDSVIEGGEFKVVVITPDDEVINIINGAQEGNETVPMKDGVSRVKLVGRKANGEIKIAVESGGDVEIKRAD